MAKLTKKQANSLQRARRVRTTVTGTTARPRLSVNVSNLHVSAQIIDDENGNTLVAASTVGQKVNGSLSEKAAWVGTEIAKKAKAAKVGRVVFDRGARLYHGRVKALADAARNAGLEF